VLRRVTALLAIVAALAWSCLLFGIGLDDVVRGDTKPGVIFSIVLLCLLIAGLVYGLCRLVCAHVVTRLVRRRARCEPVRPRC
jgi:ABC-type transport system involved in cytochrome c biogenesis permease subunit